ncbi:flagellar filament capping protein FliD [Pantoea sp. B65]|uniref:flagellar filament capping protein FliD n=1 Tax=Pantoea sp. B65 TaxID=2813359 RepID=UPI0039B69815
MNLGMEPSQWAELLANNSIAALQGRLQSQQKTIKAQQAALTSLKTAMTDFRNTLKSFGTSSSGIVKNSATASSEGYVSLKATSAASKGLYHIEVLETAKAKQEAFEGLTDADLATATGTMTLKIGDQQLDIDLSTVNNLGELRDAINASSSNPGATASLIRQNGELMLLLASNETGVDNAYTLDVSNSNIAGKFTPTEISQASNAVVSMGNMRFESSSNSFNQLIPGVELTVIQKTEAGKPLVISVDNDMSGTKEQVQSFVDAYNKLRGELDKLTKSGGADGGRGALAGDSGIRALEEQLNALLRADYNGSFLRDFGITPDKDGMLKLDSDAFEEAMKTSPARLDALFSGSNGLLKKMDKGLDSYLSTSTGSIKQRQDTLDRKNEQLSSKEQQIQLRYDAAYQRYFRQFSRVQAAMAQMESTMGQFW